MSNTLFAPGSASRCFALVPCAGGGSRAGGDGPKQYRPLAGSSVVGHTLAALAQVARIEATLVVLAPDDRRFREVMPAFEGDRGWLSFEGGATRAASVRAGLRALRERGVAAHDWVLVHDAARCALRPEWVERLIDACADDEVGGLLALPLADTLKRGDEGERVEVTVPRERMWAAQTPQMFRLALLERALDHAGSAGLVVTDEAGAVEALGHAPRLVAGDVENLKLTWPGDFALAQRLLMTRTRPLAAAAAAAPPRITLREVTPENLRAVLRLAVRPDQQAYVANNATSIAQASFSDEAWYRAVYDADEPVGFVMLADETLKPTPPAEPAIGLWRLMIDARHQRRGVGREVMRLIVEHVRTRPGVRRFHTSYVPEPGGPGPFYLGLGFEPTGEVDEGEVVVVLPVPR